MKIFNNLYAYRELLKSNIKKEIRGKYKGSLLGVLWSFINPLLQVLVYAIVFPYIMRMSTPHYLQFLIIGIIPWTFFTTVITQGTQVIRNNSGIIKKVYFPREILPISIVFSGLVNFFISCIIILGFCVPVVGFSWKLILLPVLAIIQSLLSLGIVFILSAVNVYIKDVEYIVVFIINMLFYGTPILYAVDMFKDAPAILVNLVNLNPMTTLIQSYRDIFLYHTWPDFNNLFWVLIFSIILVVIGYLIFDKLEKGFAEEL